MRIISVDFETYYSQTFSLKKLTTEEYIRSPEFETIGVGVKVGTAPAVWFSGTKAETKNFLDGFDWGNAVAVAHNAMFDMAILNWHYDIRPKRIADTLSMARAVVPFGVGGSLDALTTYYGLGVKGTEVIQALGKRRLDFTPEELARYGAYCCNDADLTAKLFTILAADFPLSELRLIDLTIRMFSEPVLEIDVPLLRSHLVQVTDKKEELLKTAVADKADLMSNPKFAKLLELAGIDPPMKISPKTGKEAFAFSKSDEEFVALLEHEDPMVQVLVAARLGVKSTLEETRTQRFIEVASRGPLPIPLRYYAAHTGRWGGDDKVNLQNLPRNSPLKYAMVPPKGFVMVDSDSSQIEARTLAWLAEQNDLVAAFDAGEDVYKAMAAAIYNKPEARITADERFVGKTTILGAGYGMGAARFRKQLKNSKVYVNEDEARIVVETYRNRYPRIPLLWKQATKALDATLENRFTTFGRDGLLVVEGEEGIVLPNRLRIRYPNLRRHKYSEGNNELIYDTKKGRTVVPNRIYGGKCVENVCQALARIIIGEQMLLVAKKYPPALTVHDAVGCVVPEAEGKAAKAYIELCMKTRPAWAPDLPLNCEAGIGATYGDC